MKLSFKQANLALVTSLSLFTVTANAGVTVNEAWVRGTVPGQQATGAFMRLTSDTNAKLVEAKSGIAKSVEIHEMVMEDDVMKMRQIPNLDLPKDKVVELKPGGYHIMFIDLHEQVKENNEVALELVVENQDGSVENIVVKAPVKSLTAKADSSTHAAMDHGDSKHENAGHGDMKHDDMKPAH